jgi:Ca2+/Na+ antiporter
LKTVKRPVATVARMRAVLGALFALVVADGVITSFIMKNGLGREWNPFLQVLVREDQFLSTKVAAAFLSVLLLWYVFKKRPRAAMTAGLLIVMVYTAIVYWNLMALFAASA